MKRTAPTASQLVQRSLYTHQRSCLCRGGAVTSIGIGTSRCASSDVSSSFRPVAVPLQSIHLHRNTRSINDNVNSISSLNHRRHNQRQQQQRHFSSVPSPTISTSQIQSSILSNAPQIAHHLATHGYYTTTNFLPPPTISLLRSQAITLRTNGRFEPSWSEAIQSDGSVTRFDKEGVFACEPDGQDYDSAPDLITYMSLLLRTLPQALNDQSAIMMEDVQLSNSTFNAKLAVTRPGGSKYPLHIDNPRGWRWVIRGN
eukprot:g9019.t1 g9019   contig34:651600-652370(+)